MDRFGIEPKTPVLQTGALPAELTVRSSKTSSRLLLPLPGLQGDRVLPRGSCSVLGPWRLRTASARMKSVVERSARGSVPLVRGWRCRQRSRSRSGSYLTGTRSDTTTNPGEDSTWRSALFGTPEVYKLPAFLHACAARTPSEPQTPNHDPMVTARRPFVNPYGYNISPSGRLMVFRCPDGFPHPIEYWRLRREHGTEH